MSPFNLGGEMIRSVGFDKTTFNDLPHKFEAGTPAIAEASASGPRSSYISEIGSRRSSVTSMPRRGDDGQARRASLGARVRAAADRRAGIVSFDVEGIHPHDVAQILDWEGVAVRAGHHCTQPLMTRLGVSATTRASFYVYSIPEEIERLVAGLHKVKASLG
jgi:cysteine desulfurase/selenocysteine lyase